MAVTKSHFPADGEGGLTVKSRFEPVYVFP
jgi:hypothetical protein